MHFKIVTQLHVDEENDVVFFYILKRLRFFFFIPYYSRMVFNSSNDFCRFEYRKEGEQIIKSLTSSKINWFKRTIKRWL
jgi:hypothetical protein